MKNSYEIRGGHVAILIERRPWHKPRTVEALIDIADLAKACEFPGTWRAQWNPHAKTFYVRGACKAVGDNPTLLHRWITNCPRGLVVDHDNHNGLDNRRHNILACTYSFNSKNRMSHSPTVLAKGEVNA